VWTTEQVRAAEDRLLARTPDGALMRKAAFGVAMVALSMLRDLTGGTAGRRVTLLVGAGNNGGDALWAGANLARRSVAVTAVLIAPDRAHAEGLAAFRKAGGRVSADLGDPDLVIDGIVGLQAHGPLRPAAASLVGQVRVPIVAVDLPSGVDPNTGAVDGPAVKAAVTVTFGARKPVHVLNTTHCGEVRLIDIGLGPELPDPDLITLDADDVAYAWRVPGPSDDKYTQGVTGIAAGSSTYPGAAVLSSGAAVLATSGMVRYAGWAADDVRGRWPELVATGTVEDAGRVQAWVVGPGLGTGQTGRDVLAAVFADSVPTCVDADGITLLAATPALWDGRDPDMPVVLTPHDREFARIADPLGIELGPDRVAAARALAKRLDVVLLLKGNATVVAAPDGRTLVNAATSSWLATAGSGDVLTGLIGALLASGLDPWLAAGCAAWLHVRAAELAADGAPAPASLIQQAIPAAIRSVRSLG
jgi:hydroxyethylthiazole kinase-like uncharacterized protein yjeF